MNKICQMITHRYQNTQSAERNGATGAEGVLESVPEYGGGIGTPHVESTKTSCVSSSPRQVDTTKQEERNKEEEELGVCPQGDDETPPVEEQRMVVSGGEQTAQTEGEEEEDMRLQDIQ